MQLLFLFFYAISLFYFRLYTSLLYMYKGALGFVDQGKNQLGYKEIS